MDNLKKIIRSRFGFALAANIITAFVSLVLFRSFWEENDDIAMAILSEGVYGQNDPHLIYSNIIYGKLLATLSLISGTVRWHAVIMYMFVFITAVAFVYVIAKNKKGRILSVILLMSVYYEVYVAVQFSKIAAFIAIMGYMVLFEVVLSCIDPKIKRKLTVAAFTAVTYSHLLRLESFLLATMIAGLFGICLVVYQARNAELRSKIASYCRIFIPVFAVCAICILIDHLPYSSGGWKEYMDYYYASADLGDYHFGALSYERNKEELQKLGISENDALMLITYEALDTRVVDPALLNRISTLDTKGTGYVNADFLKAWLKNIYDDIFTPNGLITGFVMLLGVFASKIYAYKNRWIYIAGTFAQLAVTVCVLFYYQYSGRWSHRIVYALLITQFVLLVYALSRGDEQDDLSKYGTCVIAALMFCIIGGRLGNEFEYRNYERNVTDYDGMIGYMEANKDRLFIADVFTMLDYGKYDIFRAATKGQFDNYVYTDSQFLTKSPVYKETLNRFGYSDPFEALAARDDRVILIDNISPEVELKYCNEHGDGGPYELEELDSGTNMRIYSIR